MMSADDILDKYQQGLLTIETAIISLEMLIREYEDAWYPEWVTDVPTFEEEVEIARAKAFLERLENNNTETIGEKTPLIMWKGSQADLARIYKDMQEAGLINISGRDFSKHFCIKGGKPMPPDFMESFTYKQDAISKRPATMKIQGAIREMKPESDE